MKNTNKSPKNILAKGSPCKGQVPIAIKPIAPSVAVPTVLQKQQNGPKNLSKNQQKQVTNQTVQQQQQQQPRTILVNNMSQFLTANGKNATIYPANNQVFQNGLMPAQNSTNGQTQQATPNTTGPILMSTSTPGQYQVVSAAPTSQYFQIVPISASQPPFIFASAPNAQQQQQQNQQRNASTANTLTSNTQSLYTVPNGQVYIQQASLEQQQQQQQQQNQLNQFQQIQQHLLRQFATNSAAAAGANNTPPQLLGYNPFNLAQNHQQQQQLVNYAALPPSTVTPPQIQNMPNPQPQVKKPLASKGSPVKSSSNATSNLNGDNPKKPRNESPINLKTTTTTTTTNHSTASTSSPSAYSSGGLSSVETSPLNMTNNNHLATVAGTLKTSSNLNDKKLNKRQNSNSNLNDLHQQQTTNNKVKKHKLKLNDSTTTMMDVDSNNDSQCNKKRGRPRLYVQDPVTGKSIKGQFLNNENEDINCNKNMQIVETSSCSQDDKPIDMKVVNETQQQQQQQQQEQQVIEKDLKCEIVTATPTKVEPQTKVLTHVIEGYIIKESSEPFPLKSIVNNVNDGYPKAVKQSESVTLVSTTSTTTAQLNTIPLTNNTKNNTPQKGEFGECLECGKQEKLIKFKKFCSSDCSKQYNLKSNKKRKCLFVFLYQFNFFKFFFFF